MRVLVLHSDVAADAPPDELDTLETAEAVAAALGERGHLVHSEAFKPDPGALIAAISAWRAQAVFNLVESVWGDGYLAGLAPAMLAKHGAPFTGAGAAAIALAADKTFSKQLLRKVGLPTADWVEPSRWKGLVIAERYVVKSATEDASLGLDDGAVVRGADVESRAWACRARYGGRWFAEAYLEGREFNVALLETAGGVRVLPIAEMCFEGWAESRPRILGYGAKWDDDSEDARQTVRRFGLEENEAVLARQLAELARQIWDLFRMRGYARIDFRLDACGAPMILEVNPNPCLDPRAGLAAAAAQADFDYAELVEHILRRADCG
jgi:D-alanine-D-alanine ligase